MNRGKMGTALYPLSGFPQGWEETEMKILLVDDEYYILNGLYQLIHARFPELEIFTGDYVTKQEKFCTGKNLIF